MNITLNLLLNSQEMAGIAYNRRLRHGNPLTAFAIESFKGKNPAEYANDSKSDLSGAPRNFITAVAQEDAIHELEKNPEASKVRGPPK